ncbi:ABC transporter permease [[Clostridium] sordellii]|uniref:ABC transporter permease n=1 Tax=Paraclostridium sordellii TaxID=1505 RepID=UPI0005DA9638|nr:FtsX-like permease family protein [Paeniclostridium sordellii]MDU1454242.1 ABC transporter permease [Paeniclostridium sordellii]CEO08067.1 ABC transporter permease [[Clostridium] sordellii] [Paeniclostridium sordellii]
MNFSSIIRKNFTHNFKKYISFYFVNSLIIAMLFMYGSLIFNSEVIESSKQSTLQTTVIFALIAITLFSIVFITYANIAFLKNRGKEFGMYLTLGMTTNNLIKLIFIENLGIMVASLITGLLSGTLFGRLFYMALNKILTSKPLVYELNRESFLLSIGIFVLIFLGNAIFNVYYIKKVSIIDVIKSSKKKEAGKSNKFIGVISLILLIASFYCLPKTLHGEMFKDKPTMVYVLMLLMLVCPYMVIGSFIDVVKWILSKFPKSYNNNILILGNLSHRFTAYRSILYILSLLVAVAMLCMGYSYSTYASSRAFMTADNPYDIMFIESDNYNKVKQEDIKTLLNQNNSKLTTYKVLEYMAVPVFKEDEKGNYSLDKTENIISETNYNKHMGTNLRVNPGQSVYVTEYESAGYKYPNSIFAPMNEKQKAKVQYILSNNNYVISKNDLNSILGSTACIKINKNDIKEKDNSKFTNERDTPVYNTGAGMILNDKDYETLKNNIATSAIKRMHLINAKNSDEAFEVLINHLRGVNKLDKSYWNEGSMWGDSTSDDANRNIKEAYRPVYTEELVNLRLNQSGILLFTMMFIGVLFTIANGVVLYYKVLSDIDEEEERLMSLNRIGVLKKEVRLMISKELALVFFIPIIFGGLTGLYFVNMIVLKKSTADLFMEKSIIIFIVGSIIQGIFYLISRRKYIKQANI